MGGTIQRVLVVEDDPDEQELVARVLENAGYDVVTVASGADALAFLGRARTPCLVLLDMRMADMNGWEVLSALRTARKAEHPIVIMTAVEADALPRGLAHLRKPFTAKQLLAMVRNAA